MAEPAGGRVRPNRWWTPLRILLATAVVVGTLGLVTKTPCAVADGERWFSTSPVPAGASYARLCASELPGEYATTGLAEGVLPWSDDGGRWPVNAVTVPVGILQYGAASLVQAVTGADRADRGGRDPDTVRQEPEVRREAVAYTGVVALGSLLALLLALVALARAARRSRVHDALRPWPTWSDPTLSLMPLAASPVVALLLGVGWDLVGVALVAFGLAVWTSGRARTAGVILAVATLTAWWPIVVLVALAATSLVRHARAAGRLIGVAAVTLAVGGLASYVASSGDALTEVVRRWLYRDDGVGSIWAVLRELGAEPSTVAVAAMVIGVSAFATSLMFLYAARSGDVDQTARYAFGLLAALLLVGTTYAPGYALWLLPLAVLAHPVWRDLLWWQAAEVFLVVATWWHLGGSTKAVGGSPDLVYVAAIVLHVVATVWLVARMQITAARGGGVAEAQEPDVLDQLGR